MCPDTALYGMSFPDENQDPFFDPISNFYNDIDKTLYGQLAASLPVLGGGTLSLETVTGDVTVKKLTWTEDFEILIPGSGFFMKIPFGPDQATREIVLSDGDQAVINVPLTSVGPITGYVSKINGKLTKETVNLQGLRVLGMMRNDRFYSYLPQSLSG